MWQRIEYIVWKNDQAAHKQKFTRCLDEVVCVTRDIYYKLPHLPVLQELRGKGWFSEVNYSYLHFTKTPSDDWCCRTPYGHYWSLSWSGDIKYEK